MDRHELSRYRPGLFQTAVFTMALLCVSIIQVRSEEVQVLRGEIQHSESLPPVPDERLRPGALFDKQLVSPTFAKFDWHVIPSWYAGHWRVTEETITAYHDFKTGEDKTLFDKMKNEVSWQSGMQKDASGQIWSCREVPFTSTVVLSNEIDYFHERRLDYLAVEPNKVVIEETGYQINTDVDSGRILNIVQEEAIHTYVPVNDGEMMETISKKVFGYNGRALYRRNATRQVFRDKSFGPDSAYTQSFREFLNSHGLERLIPVNF